MKREGGAHRAATRRTGTISRRELTRGVVDGLHGLFQHVERFSHLLQMDRGLSGPQLWALRLIRGAPPVTIGQLAERMFLHISSVSCLLKRLVARGLVARTRGAEDHRVVYLRLTPAGRRLAHGAPAPPRSRLPRGLGRLGDRELHEVARSVRRLRTIMMGRLGGPESSDPVR